MKAILLMLLTTISIQAFARTSLYKSESIPESINETKNQSRGREASASRNWGMIVQGNPIIVPSTVVNELHAFKPGQLVLGTIPHSVIAFSESKAPVAVRVYDDSRRSFLLIGEATLEKASKRILVTFKSIRQEASAELFDVSAQAMELDGTLGLSGEVHSGASSLFFAELLAAGAAGFADASVTRNTSVLGQVQEENSLDTRSKKALGSALSRSAERFSERQKQAPEFVTLDGPVRIKILFTEQPRRKF